MTDREFPSLHRRSVLDLWIHDCHLFDVRPACSPLSSVRLKLSYLSPCTDSTHLHCPYLSPCVISPIDLVKIGTYGTAGLHARPQRGSSYRLLPTLTFLATGLFALFQLSLTCQSHPKYYHPYNPLKPTNHLCYQAYRLLFRLVKRTPCAQAYQAASNTTRSTGEI